MADHGRQGYSHEEAFRIIATFEKVVRDAGITMDINSKLEDEFISSMDFLIRYQDRLKAETDPARQMALEITFAGLADMAAKAVAASQTKSWNQLIPHLEMLTNSRFNLYDDNNCPGIESQWGDKMIEFYLGCICCLFADAVEIDPPNNSRGDNPDIILEYGDERIALACKTIHQSNPRTLRDRIIDAARQINSDKCKCDWGITMISTRNVIQSKQYWSKYSNGMDYEPITCDVRCRLGKLTEDMGREMGNTDDVFSSKALPGVVFMSNLIVRLGETPFTTPRCARLNTMIRHACAPFKKPDRYDHILELLNHYFQVIHPIN